MATETKRISELSVTTTLSANDRVVVLANTSGNAVVKTVTVSNLTKITNTAPVSANSEGAVGSLVYDESYLYVCVAANTWLRSSLSTW